MKKNQLFISAARLRQTYLNICFYLIYYLGTRRGISQKIRGYFGIKLSMRTNGPFRFIGLTEMVYRRDIQVYMMKV